MAKIKIVYTSDNDINTLEFLCPVCKFDSGNPMPHQIKWQKDNSKTWTFDENYDFPTITPSIAVSGVSLNENGERVNDMCHMWITKGKIKFFHDCTHGMKGKQWIDMLEITND